MRVGAPHHVDERAQLDRAVCRMGVGAEAGNVLGFVERQGRTGKRKRYGNHRGSDNFLLRAETADRECQAFLLQQDNLMGI
ncbi:MAG: hypothetical protein OXJ64_14525, partial [Boseongicola sp.]|nr:hypothetical protein [Boseongicola sp.]